MRPLISIVIIFLVNSCTPRSEKTTDENVLLDTLPIPKDSSAHYFQTKNNWRDTINNALDTFVTTWFSEMLFALKEPILNSYQGEKEIYRFTWLRTFHNPISIRVEKLGEDIKVFSKQCDGEGGYEPGQLILNKNFSLSQDDYEALNNKIEQSNFWNLPTENRENQGTDGSEWVFEAIKNHNYHLVVRWSPFDEKLKDFRAIGEYLISLSKLKIPKEEIY